MHLSQPQKINGTGVLQQTVSLLTA